MSRKAAVISSFLASLLLVANLWTLPLPIGAVRWLVLLSLAGGVLAGTIEARSWSARLITVFFSAIPVLWMTVHYLPQADSPVLVLIVALASATSGRLLGQALGHHVSSGS
jgi:hypothetical protein